MREDLVPGLQNPCAYVALHHLFWRVGQFFARALKGGQEGRPLLHLIDVDLILA